MTRFQETIHTFVKNHLDSAKQGLEMLISEQEPPLTDSELDEVEGALRWINKAINCL